MARGVLFLIPSPLGDSDPAEVIPGPVLNRLKSIKRYVVEETRTARRYLSAAGLKGHIGELEFRELNEHTSPEEVESLLEMFNAPDGSPTDVGLISEAGLPAVADPGAALVALCHKHNIQVVPLVGPSSLMLALMGSGLNGQSFAFQGYLPGNDSMMTDLLAVLQPATRLCVAANITQPDETILTKTVKAWRTEHFTIGKRPCVFLFLAK